MPTPTVEQLTELHAQIKSGRVTREGLQAYLRDPRKVEVLHPLHSKKTVTIDYSRSLGEMTSDGHYGKVDSDLTYEHFPIKGTGKKTVELKVFVSNHDTCSEHAVEHIRCVGFKPAGIEHLLAFNDPFWFEIYCACHCMIALGSVWEGTKPEDPDFPSTEDGPRVPAVVVRGPNPGFHARALGEVDASVPHPTLELVVSWWARGGWGRGTAFLAYK